MNEVLTDAIEHWGYLAPLLKLPTNHDEFDKQVSYLDELLMIVKDDEDHPLMGLINILSNIITNYEKEHFPIAMGTGIDALKHLMQANNLHQSDFPEIASQGVMSEIMRGKRTLNVRQIKLLAKRFGVDPATFIDD